MKYLITLVLMFYLQIGLCQKNGKPPLTKPEKILEINYDRGGGEMGGVETLRITKDSIIYFKSTYSQLKAKTQRLKNEFIEWDKLRGLLNLNEFDSTPNGKNEREVDGIDTQIYIKTSVKTHLMIVNYTVLKQYPSVERFIAELTKQIKLIDK